MPDERGWSSMPQQCVSQPAGKPKAPRPPLPPWKLLWESKDSRDSQGLLLPAYSDIT